jgi:2-succinyl-6-hydroxy-2,4-cyclohexadiene-1-carboxylate synthase
MDSKQIIIKTDQSTNYLFKNSKSSSIPTFFLHGFTGSADSWKEVINKLSCNAIAVDIVGHRESSFNDIDSDYDINSWCDDFKQIIESLNYQKINLCGYSMGGRLAIAFAAAYPARINSLILESCSLGIDDKKAKNSRYEEDLSLSTTITQDFPEFARIWQKNTLFVNQEKRNKAGFEIQQENRLSHNPVQLAKAMMSFSQGTMRSYEEEFSKFDFPILIINGSDDLKYRLAGKMMSEMNKQAIQHVVSNANHNVHLESTDAFINLIK